MNGSEWSKGEQKMLSRIKKAKSSPPRQHVNADFKGHEPGGSGATLRRVRMRNKIKIDGTRFSNNE